MKREICTALMLEAKQEKGISFQQIADEIGRSIVWTTSAILGQNTCDAIESKKVCELLGLGIDIEKAFQQFPSKGTEAIMPPTDPLIYRLYEIVLIYGDTIKQVIHEKLGDGIMSAIDFNMQIEKEENPNGDRVKITLDGKFLPYKKW
ncbi:cyanase [Flavobacterium soyangense]|uniref:Cyanate hydratase n=1 Tax=Flavobacterium soyangense TaxID=2023265 RepID=A0A930XWY6_9FLAO|nr:cyanase [Flavobacterium soyangense]MBF2709682.1 cyanase [Flavobacterium soyangense]